MRAKASQPLQIFRRNEDGAIRFQFDQGVSKAILPTATVLDRQLRCVGVFGGSTFRVLLGRAAAQFGCWNSREVAKSLGINNPGLRLGSHVFEPKTAIDRQDRSGDIVGGLGDEKTGRTPDVFRLAQSPPRQSLARRIDHRVRECSAFVRCIDPTRLYRVDIYAVRKQFDGHALCQMVEGRFGGSIRGRSL